MSLECRIVSLTAAALLLASVPARAADIRYAAVNGFNVIAINGDIVQGDASTFNAIRSKLPLNAATKVFLSSNGGDLTNGLRIGEMIHAKGYQTIVGDDAICASVCGLMWLAGSVRHIAATGHVGFHAAYNSNTHQETGSGNALVGAYLTNLGYSYAVVEFATSAAPSEINWLHPDNAAQLGIALELDASASPPLPRPALPTVTVVKAPFVSPVDHDLEALDRAMSIK